MTGKESLFLMIGFWAGILLMVGVTVFNEPSKDTSQVESVCIVKD